VGESNPAGIQYYKNLIRYRYIKNQLWIRILFGFKNCVDPDLDSESGSNGKEEDEMKKKSSFFAKFFNFKN
jgi:hypothetical protein